MQNDLLIGIRALELYGATLQRKGAVAANAIGVTADDRAVDAAPLVGGEVVESEHHIGLRSLAVRHVERDDDAAEVADAGHESRPPGERVEIDFLTRCCHPPVETA